MGSVNTQSVREEAERIKNEFQRIAANKKMDAEISMLMQSMFMLINLLIAIFLEKTTKKNNKNSSKPSSQTDKDESSTTHAGTNGKGKQESDAVANNTRTIETVTVARVTQCDVCGQDLTDAPCEHTERRTKIDIVFETVVEHIDAEIKYCDSCDCATRKVA
jgi:transposase